MSVFKLRDRVTPVNDARVPAACRGRVFVVAKINPKNIRCTAEDGGRGINFPAELLVPATDANANAPATVIGVPFVPQEFFSVGEIVTTRQPYRKWGWTTSTPLVVIGGRNGKVNVALLGGDQDRYLRCRPTGLERRNREWLLGILAKPAEDAAKALARLRQTANGTRP